ncbi:MAG: hypothetical protein AUK47_05010 [Deltaproteobacteria bacterium CG2_30_63_29]|nr:MAG: hypothetical protein AUK47_05010 [Deltaproteobacteria bacterium CG2_30_63_29]PIW00412.1 MAG: hypothetical protein COW42_07885 [Deltaproteobacteria bacterium CG17_big_fil_post_rev_8_21_14_2_50_63_7]PJB40911.1 MAG: hypothetical protein CO108_13875 [Deltaproteobacteria bacterium CG_4_9_14_3_um_filter_63_12]
MLDQELQESTLALQHYYDIGAVTRRTSLGRIYDATQLPFERPVSVWVLDKLSAMGANPELVKRIGDNAKRAGLLPSAVNLTVLDVGKLDDGVLFIVFDRLVGKSLRETIKARGTLKLWETLRVVEQLAEALIHCRQVGISHTALVSSKVDIVESDSLRLRLFGQGIALTRDDLFTLDDAIVTQELVAHLPPVVFKVQERRTNGTIAHETVSEDELETKPFQVHQADIYTLAVVAYECLSGRHPYFREGKDVGDGVLAMLREDVPSLDHFNEVPKPVDQVILKALQRHDEGYSSIEAFVATLRAVMSQEDRRLADESAKPGWLKDAVVLPKAAQMASKGHRLTLTKALIAAVLLLVCSNAIAFYLATGSRLLDAELVPHFAPPAAAGEGVDVVFRADLVDERGQVREASAEVYMVSSRGETVRVSSTPFVLRNQKQNARLRVVLGRQGFKSQQLDVVVSNQNEQLMVVSSTLEPLAEHRQLAVAK